MNRRAYLARACAAAVLVGLAGCGAGDGVSDVEPADGESAGETPEQDVMTTTEPVNTSDKPPGMELAAVDANPENPDGRLSIGWRGQVQTRVAPVDENIYTVPNGGEKFIVVQCRFECEAGSIRLHTGVFGLRIGDEVRQSIQAGDGDYALANVELETGESLSRFILFSAPWDATQGELLIREEGVPQSIAATWSHDASLQFGAKA